MFTEEVLRPDQLGTDVLDLDHGLFLSTRAYPDGTVQCSETDFQDQLGQYVSGLYVGVGQLVYSVLYLLGD
jgi:hypothetical protein